MHADVAKTSQSRMTWFIDCESLNLQILHLQDIFQHLQKTAFYLFRPKDFCASGTSISAGTVRRGLHDAGLYARRLVTNVSMNPR
ncbi:hypothetical protein TNCV_4955731 [Trichonephila clavipes]|nr:hypothetical protein TNCV_4955731 [Trichonephila clavipes]